MPNRPHPKKPSRAKLFHNLGRGMTLREAAVKAGYRRSASMLCHLRKEWTREQYRRLEADKVTRERRRVEEEAQAVAAAKDRRRRIAERMQIELDRKEWDEGAKEGHVLTFEGWRNCGKPSPHHVPQRDKNGFAVPPVPARFRPVPITWLGDGTPVSIDNEVQYKIAMQESVEEATRQLRREGNFFAPASSIPTDMEPTPTQIAELAKRILDSKVLDYSCCQQKGIIHRDVNRAHTAFNGGQGSFEKFDGAYSPEGGLQSIDSHLYAVETEGCDLAQVTQTLADNGPDAEARRAAEADRQYDLQQAALGNGKWGEVPLHLQIRQEVLRPTKTETEPTTDSVDQF